MSSTIRKLVLSLIFVAGSLGVASQAQAQGVAVNIAPSTVETDYYDPEAKPAKIAPDMKGLTEPLWKFSCHLNWTHRDQPDLFSFQITTANCDLSLPITVTLPKNAQEHLKAHEMGHVYINQHFYKTYCEAAIKKAAGAVIGKKIEIKADNYEDAKKQVVQQTVHEISENFRAETSGPAEKANVLYDALTNHGRRTEVDQDAAAKQAIAQIEQTAMPGAAAAGTDSAR